MDGALTLRPARPGDAAFLRRMLRLAAYWRPGAHLPPVDEVVVDPHLSVYLERWPRTGDRGVVADVNERPVGAAWYRLFDAARHGYGYVDPATPELSVAVEGHARGLGIGRALLTTLMAQARLDGHRALSLSVERDNPALRLYTSVGFVAVGPGGNAPTMLAHLGRSRR